MWGWTVGAERPHTFFPWLLKISAKVYANRQFSSSGTHITKERFPRPTQSSRLFGKDKKLSKFFHTTHKSKKYNPFNRTPVPHKEAHYDSQGKIARINPFINSRTTGNRYYCFPRTLFKEARRIAASASESPETRSISCALTLESSSPSGAAGFCFCAGTSKPINQLS